MIRKRIGVHVCDCTVGCTLRKGSGREEVKKKQDPRWSQKNAISEMKCAVFLTFHFLIFCILSVNMRAGISSMEQKRCVCLQAIFERK